MEYRVNFPTGQRNKVHHSYVWLGSLVGVGAALVVGLLSNVDALATLVQIGFDGPRVIPFVLLVLVGIVLLYGAAVGIAVLSWRNLSFVFDEKEFSLYSGILTKRRVHVPYARVQSVNHKQSLVQRVAGVCTVEIDTAGGASNKAVKVPYVQLGTGEAIRNDLFVRKAAAAAGAENQVVCEVLPLQAASVPVPGVTAGGAPVPPAGTVPSAGPVPPARTADAAGMPIQVGADLAASGAPAPSGASFVPDGQAQGNLLDSSVGGIAEEFRGVYGEAIPGMEPVRYERRLDNRELLLASVSHSHVGTGVLVALFSLLVAAVPLLVSAPALGVVGVLTLPLLFGAIVLVAALSVGTTALSYGNFSVRRRGSRVEVERGMLQRDFSGIDVDRIQSIVIKQSFIRRLMGYCEVSLGRINAGGGEEQNTNATLNSGGLVVHPFLRLDQANGLIDELLPEFADRPMSADFKGLPDVALRRGIVRRCFVRNAFFWVALCAVACQLLFNLALSPLWESMGAEGLGAVRAFNVACIVFYVGFVVQVGFQLWGTIWWKRGSGFAMNRAYAALCNDGLATETVYVPRAKIQDAFTRSNPFQRRAHTVTIAALTAAGVRGSYAVLWDVDEQDGQAWLDWLKPRVNVVQ